MNLTELLNEDSTLDDMGVLLEKPFEVSREDICLIVAIGQKQRQKTGTEYDRSVEFTAFLSYVANQLKAQGDDLGYACFRKAIPYVQQIEVSGNGESAEKADATRKFGRALGPLRHSTYFEKTDKIFGECFNHFLSVIPSPLGRPGESRSEVEIASAHYMNNGLAIIREYYESSVEVSQPDRG
ncbi:MAG: hypothetical protein V1729_03040 [Candidatus Woesearchaeota archaeon]